MVTRIYIDNFRSLVNFELKLDRMNLLIGANGSGKSSVFDVLRKLQDFIVGAAKVHEVFPASGITRWQTSRTQRFELDLQVGDDVYTYKLLVENDQELRKMRVEKEHLALNGDTLFKCMTGEAKLFRDDGGGSGYSYPFDWSQSGVGVLHERPENKKLTQFKRHLNKIVIARPVPALMQVESRGEEERLTLRMENFASWYRYLAQEQMGAMAGLLQELRKTIPGFSSLRLKESGEDSRSLKVQYERTDGGKALEYSFSELSDGEKMLVALYSLIFGLKDEGITLFLDEPDNYLALGEIQPWLTTLADACGESVEQAVLISHHPEIINYLGGSKGRWFIRDPESPTRVDTEPKTSTDGLTLSETVARGWSK